MIRKAIIAAIVTLFVVFAATAQDVRFAVVRIPSHGCSGVVIETGEGRSTVLTCAHAFRGNDAAKALAFDVPCNPNQVPEPAKAKMKVVGIDHALDLVLIEMEWGPCPVACPLAMAGHAPGRNIWSVGFDEMKWPATMRTATITGSTSNGNITTTRERPWHGRSGGGLIDLDAKALIGITSYYTGPQTRQEVVPGAYGGYVSHQACLGFLQSLRGQAPSPGPKPAPNGAPGILRIEQSSQAQRSQSPSEGEIIVRPTFRAAEPAPNPSRPMPWPVDPPRLPPAPIMGQPPSRLFDPFESPCPGGSSPGRR